MKFTVSALVALAALPSIFAASENTRGGRNLMDEIQELKEANRELREMMEQLKADKQSPDREKIPISKLRPSNWRELQERKGRKLFSNDQAVCYDDGEEPVVGVVNFAAFLFFPTTNIGNFIGSEIVDLLPLEEKWTDVAFLDFGGFWLEKRHSLMIEVHASTLLLNTKGGEYLDYGPTSAFPFDFGGPQVWATLTGIAMAPFLYKCPITDSGEICVTTGTIVDGVTPSASLPIDGHVLFGSDWNLAAFEFNPMLRNSILGSLSLSTHSAKFFYPKKVLGKGNYFLQFGFFAGAAGLNIQIPALQAFDWTLQGASLGPHFIDVEKVKVDYEECDYEEDVNAAPTSGLSAAGPFGATMVDLTGAEPLGN